VLPELMQTGPKEKKKKKRYSYIHSLTSVLIVGPCHHGMARPQVAD
jgi:hypothetical protein